MHMDRRRLLALASSGLALGIAGCSEEGTIGTPDGEDEEEDDPADSTATEEASEADSSTFELGETAVYRESDDDELAFTPRDADLKDALVYSNSSSLYSEVPDQSGRTFLRVEVEAENTGSEPVDVPADPPLTIDGKQYETTFTSAYSNSSYDQFQEIQPGASVSGWLVYEIEPSDGTGELIADFDQFSESTTATWRIDVGSLERETYDYPDLSAGDTLEFGTEDRRFSIGPTSVEEAQSYTYSSSDYTFEEEPDSGDKFVFVTLSAENVGDERVTVPSTFDISLIAGTSESDVSYYSGDRTEYEGGEISPGIAREGILLFEVDESATSYELAVELTSEITARWNL
ncbi:MULTISPECIES: DUF4352 domain-containing protein [Haloarcula]|uniref:DUF4352 domain-containing protein n=1 Tax=Haloarcula TaxID=2237 RepID=UPI0023E8B1C2|nr:DUF4352 domain-containing protein [Halomicroarcula sp. SHR3]